jgi:hypothetical protein
MALQKSSYQAEGEVVVVVSILKPSHRQTWEESLRGNQISQKHRQF